MTTTATTVAITERVSQLLTADTTDLFNSFFILF